MSKWHSFLEYIQFPLKVLFLSIVLLGIGSLIENPNLGLLELFDSNILVTISEALRYIGGFMIELFPLLVFLNLLARKYEDSAPVFIGFVSLILITLMMMLLSTGEFPSYYYANTLGIQIEMSSATELLSRMHSPFNTGIISIVYPSGGDRHFDRRGQKHENPLPFLDRDRRGPLGDRRDLRDSRSPRSRVGAGGSFQKKTDPHSYDEYVRGGV